MGSCRKLVIKLRENSHKKVTGCGSVLFLAEPEIRVD